MTLAQLKTKADTKLATLWSLIQTKQDACFAKTGRYFQVLATSLPIDGADTVTTLQFRTDLDYVKQIDTNWSDTFPFMLEIHEHDTGYKAVVTVRTLTGAIYQRERDNLQNDSGWYQMWFPLNVIDSRYGIN